MPSTPVGPQIWPYTEASDLAAGAEETAPPIGLDPHDGAPAARARRAFPVIDIVEPLERTDVAEDVSVLLVRQRRSAVLDGVLQGFDYCPVQPADLLRSQG